MDNSKRNLRSSISVNYVKDIAQEMTDISKELEIYKTQCEDIMKSLALPHGAGVSVRVRLNKCINELEEEITYLKWLSDSLNEIATLYEETEKRIIEHPEQKVKKPKREEKESLSDIPEDEQVYDADAIIDAFMDTWAGDVLALVMMSTSRSDLMGKTISDLGKGMTLIESLIDTEEETKGMIQALPKYAVDTVEGAMALVDIMWELYTNKDFAVNAGISIGMNLGVGAVQLWQKLEKEGFDSTVKEIAGAAWQGAVTKYEDAFVNVSARERGENEMRAAIGIVEAITAVKALKSLAMSGKGLNKLDDAARVLDSIDDDVAKHADDILPDGDDAAKALDDGVASGIGSGVPDSSKFPQTRSSIHEDLVNRGYNSTGTTDNGYVVYKHPNGNRVTIKPTGEVISTVRLPVDPTNMSPKAPKYNQRVYYDGTIIPDELNDHTTGHFVG